jgi:putative FmdB family regulatory protein
MYEYECKKCEYIFEQLQKMDARPLRKCPKCGAKKGLTKILSGSVIYFNGEGWTPTFHPKKGKK